MTDKTPFFSIVTVCYNSERTIERTILSVLSQDYTDYEYIIIDGASKDNTLKIVNKYADNPLYNGKFRVYSEKDKGIYDAFNKGCKKAVGKYIWLVNSDDFIESNALSTIYNKIQSEKEPYPIISGSLRFVYTNGMPPRISSKNEEDAKFLYKIANMGINHPATLVPRETYERIGYYDDRYRIMADMDWFRRAYESDERIVWIDEVLTNMQDGGVSTTLHLSELFRDRWIYTKKFYNSRYNRVIAYLKWIKIYLMGVAKSWVMKMTFFFKRK